MIANEAGWTLHLSHDSTAEWNGLDMTPGGVRTTGVAMGHFGSGIVTFPIQAILRTEPGTQLLAGPPTNYPKDGATGLSGVVETDWAVATFTMNWKLTRPGRVEWAAGEPYCMVTPIHIAECRDELHVLPIAGQVREQYAAWSAHRSAWPEAPKRQLHYRKGESPGGAEAETHYTRIR